MADVTEYKQSDARTAKDWLGMAQRDVAKSNTATNRKELQKMQELAKSTDASYKEQLARNERVGAGRGEVNPEPVGKAKGGKISSASSRADGIAQRGKTRGTMVMCGGGYMKGKK